MRKTGGLTLIEIMVALAIMCIVIVALSMFFKAIINSLGEIQQQSMLQREGENVLLMMEKDLRLVGINHSNTAADPAFFEANVSSVTFYAIARDVSGDGLLDPTTTWSENVDRERITYSVTPAQRVERRGEILVTGNIVRQLISSPAVKVTNFDFVYSSSTTTGLIQMNDSDLKASQNRKDIRFVGITLGMARGKYGVKLNTAITARNLN